MTSNCNFKDLDNIKNLQIDNKSKCKNIIIDGNNTSLESVVFKELSKTEKIKFLNNFTNLKLINLEGLNSKAKNISFEESQMNNLEELILNCQNSRNLSFDFPIEFKKLKNFSLNYYIQENYDLVFNIKLTKLETLTLFNVNLRNFIIYNDLNTLVNLIIKNCNFNDKFQIEGNYDKIENISIRNSKMPSIIFDKNLNNLKTLIVENNSFNLFYSTELNNIKTIKIYKNTFINLSSLVQQIYIDYINDKADNIVFDTNSNISYNDYLRKLLSK